MDYFKLFANCILVKGYGRSTINDLQRKKIQIINNDIANLLSKLNNKVSINRLLENYSDLEKNDILSLLENLEEMNFGFFCTKESFDNFIPLEQKINYSNEITNIICEFNAVNFERIKQIRKLIQQTRTESITLIFYNALKNKDLIKIIKLLSDSFIVSIDIVMKESENLNIDFFTSLNSFTNLINSITIHSSNEETTNKTNYNFEINYIKKRIKDFSFCGAVSINHMNIHQRSFLESLNHNSCLYKKMSIDINGNIKNCPNINNSFGTIDAIENMKHILEDITFREIGKIKKDEIEVCKDCEFRHVCTDCRAYTENPKDIFSKPLKCGYDPYTNEWSEWSKNPLKEKTIEYYNL